MQLLYEDFLGSMITTSLCPRDSHLRLGLKKIRICLHLQPTRLDHLIQQAADLHFCVTPYNS